MRKHTFYSAILAVFVLSVVVSPIYGQNTTGTTIYNLSIIAPYEGDLVCTEINRTYRINCDIDEESEAFSDLCREVSFEYTVRFISSLEVNDTQENTLFIYDYMDRVVDQRAWDFMPGETKEVDFSIPFVCPATLAKEINFDTCSVFLDQYVGDTSPLMFTLALGTRDCHNDLRNVTANFISCQDKVGEIDKDRVTLRDQVVERTIDVEDCFDNLNDPGGLCDQRITTEKAETATCLEEKQNLVDPLFMYIAILFILVSGILVAKEWMW